MSVGSHLACAATTGRTSMARAQKTPMTTAASARTASPLAAPGNHHQHHPAPIYLPWPSWWTLFWPTLSCHVIVSVFVVAGVGLGIVVAASVGVGVFVASVRVGVDIVDATVRVGVVDVARTGVVDVASAGVSVVLDGVGPVVVVVAVRVPASLSSPG